MRGKTPEFPTKPDPASALDICARLGGEPQRTTFVGDTSVDIKTGKNGGFYTVGVEWGFRGRDELTAAGADFIARSAEDIFANFQNRK